MTNSSVPFRRLLVPYDGSDPARAALRLALTLANGAAADITLLGVVDDTPIMAESASAMVVIDPGPMMEALEAEFVTLLADADAQCRADGVVPMIVTVHDRPVAAILATIESDRCDLVIMGTHARNPIARTFMGSTTEGVLKATTVPVLTLRDSDIIGVRPFSSAVVAVDDTEPSASAVAVAARFARNLHTHVVACHVASADNLYNSAAAVGYTEDQVAAGERRTERDTVRKMLDHAGLPADTTIEITEGETAGAIIATADTVHANLIVAGTHGRAGLSRFFLGSVAARLVRESTVPVLIVPTLAVGSNAQSVREGQPA